MWRSLEIKFKGTPPQVSQLCLEHLLSQRVSVKTSLFFFECILHLVVIFRCHIIKMFSGVLVNLKLTKGQQKSHP